MVHIEMAEGHNQETDTRPGENEAETTVYEASAGEVAPVFTNIDIQLEGKGEYTATTTTLHPPSDTTLQDVDMSDIQRREDIQFALLEKTRFQERLKDVALIRNADATRLLSPKPHREQHQSSGSRRSGSLKQKISDHMPESVKRAARVVDHVINVQPEDSKPVRLAKRVGKAAVAAVATVACGPRDAGSADIPVITEVAPTAMPETHPTSLSVILDIPDRAKLLSGDQALYEDIGGQIGEQWPAMDKVTVITSQEPETQGVLFIFEEKYIDPLTGEPRQDLGFGRLQNGQMEVVAYNLNDDFVQQQIRYDLGYVVYTAPRLGYNETNGKMEPDLNAENAVTVLMPITGTEMVDGVEVPVLDLNPDRPVFIQIGGETEPSIMADAREAMAKTINIGPRVRIRVTPTPAGENASPTPAETEEPTPIGPIDANVEIPSIGEPIMAAELGEGGSWVVIQDETSPLGDIRSADVGHRYFLDDPKGQAELYEILGKGAGLGEQAQAEFEQGGDFFIEMPEFLGVTLEAGGVNVGDFVFILTKDVENKPGIIFGQNNQQAYIQNDRWLPSPQSTIDAQGKTVDAAHYRWAPHSDGWTFIYIGFDNKSNQDGVKLSKLIMLHILEAANIYGEIVQNGGTMPNDILLKSIGADGGGDMRDNGLKYNYEDYWFAGGQVDILAP